MQTKKLTQTYFVYVWVSFFVLGAWWVCVRAPTAPKTKKQIVSRYKSVSAPVKVRRSSKERNK